MGPVEDRPRIGGVLDDVPEREQVHAAGAHRHVEDRPRVQLQAVVLAGEAAHPRARLAAERLVAALPRGGEKGSARRAHVEDPAPGGLGGGLDLPQAAPERPLTHRHLGHEALVGPAPVALEDQVPAQPGPDVVEAAGQASHHLVLEGLVARGAEHGRQVDGPARLALRWEDHLEGIRSADVAGDRLELRRVVRVARSEPALAGGPAHRGLRPRAASSRKPAVTALRTTPTTTSAAATADAPTSTIAWMAER